MTTGAAAVEPRASGAAGVDHVSKSLGTWHRRYGVGPSEHAVGRHRRYSPADAARIASQTPLAYDVATSAGPGAGPETPGPVDGLAELLGAGCGSLVWAQRHQPGGALAAKWRGAGSPVVVGSRRARPL